jgi:general stress protein YciG
MAPDKRMEQGPAKKDRDRAADQGQRSGRPNPGNPAEDHEREHKPSYGGEGGEPRTGSHEREPSKPE